MHIPLVLFLWVNAHSLIPALNLFLALLKHFVDPIFSQLKLLLELIGPLCLRSAGYAGGAGGGLCLRAERRGWGKVCIWILPFGPGSTGLGIARLLILSSLKDCHQLFITQLHFLKKLH